MKEIICPYCRSKLQYDGQLDFSIPKIQVLTCPVCRYPQQVASDFPLPVKWINPKISERHEPLIAWSIFKNTLPPAYSQSEPPATEETSSWADVSKGISESFKGIGQGATNTLIIVAVILALIFLLKK